MNERLKGNLDLLVLEVLAARPAHGYDVIVSLRDRSAGAFDLPEGTVYPALYRLERSGLLASSWTSESGRRRRVYSLTATGRRALAAQRRQWREFVSAVGSVLGAPA
ncbi:MAG TPA: PadR family transcriptional regulator [Jatrophihabitantaceae bacterium]|jgi:transcriptional regulator